MPPNTIENQSNDSRPVESEAAATHKLSPPEPDIPWSISDNWGRHTRITQFGVVQGGSLTVHSAALSGLIREIIKFYPGQNLNGNSIIFNEPYGALMHHMQELETAHVELLQREEDPTAQNAQLSNAFGTLLEFLRPLYQECFVPAQNRLSQKSPTIAFDDLWVLYKPNSLAYAKLNNDHWIGCKIGAVTRWPKDIMRRSPVTWDIGSWHLQTDFSTEEIGCATRNTQFREYDGELNVMDLILIPCQYFDKTDSGTRKRLFEERGQKILDVLWSPSRQYRHRGKHLLGQSLLKCDVLVAGSDELIMGEKSIWQPQWADPGPFIPKDDTTYRALEQKIHYKRHSRDLFTDEMRFMLFPCLHAITLRGADPYLLHVDNLEPLKFPDTMPEPIIHHSQLRNILSLAERQIADSSVSTEIHGEIPDRSVIVLLIGDSGVGKQYTARYIAWKTKRPLIQVTGSSDMGEVGSFLPSLCKTHHALVSYLPSAHPGDLPHRLESMVFISVNKEDTQYVTNIQPSVQMAISFSSLDYKRQQRLWLRMMDIYCAQHDSKLTVTFDRAASSFLSSADMPKVNWNGHDIKKCLQAAISSARASGKADKLEKTDASVVVEVEHLKEAMNMAFACRSAIDSMVHQAPSPQRHLITQRGQRKMNDTGDDEGSDQRMLDFGRFHDYDELSDDESSPSSPAGGTVRPEPASEDARSRKLCIAELNMVEWSTFKTLGTTELFRSKRFYAVDVLVGEPQIWREVPSLPGRKRRTPIQSIAPQSLTPGANRQQNTADSAVDLSLPERVRINSPAIIKAFSEVHVDDSSNLRGSFLLFRPYKVLSYYEKELREWTEKLEENDKASRKDHEQDSEHHNEDLQADIAEMKCLLSFIDTYLKEKQEEIKSTVMRSLTFDDLWFLFKPGHTVVRNDMRQAYRVVRVATSRHHIKEHKDTSLSFYKDDAPVEFEQRHIFIKCVHIDFNGLALGPVPKVFSIAHFGGEKAITSLSIYPIEFADEPEITKESFIERGKVFVKAGGIEHMHFRGLTLPAEESSKLRDEIDSQVVIDFEEALNRYPEWQPGVVRTILEESDDDYSSSDDEDDWRPEFHHTQQRSSWKCIPECCSRETVYHDEFIDDRTRSDYLSSQANENSNSPSAAIESRILSEMTDTLKDDDFLIMSYRVFGFVLRSRKWHPLDLAEASPAEMNSDGFDQLVLPEGHKDIVTSMITKHFRDRKSASTLTQTDIVRGKGRGLIMLLHGVPGVGKTSTAECLADVFNRPLFQVTSGDLGVTAGDVDENLEENFSLANRWNCILLIDEADVFLAQRNKEDFVQNSLVAVFLRIMEYYSGVLFLTTNRVGVFDEAFSSRIHISLYYPPLDRQQTLEIFKKNWERIIARSKEEGRQIDVDQSELTQFAMDYYDNNNQGRWNGRQIRNAFQSALAMAEFEVLGMEGVNEDEVAVKNDQEADQTIRLGKKHFEEVAKAYKGFVDYLNKVYGAGSARRARENMWRFDPDDESASKRPTALSQRLKFTGDPMQQPPRNVDPGFGPSQYPRGYGPGYENPSNYSPMTPPRGGYSGSHEFQYSPAGYAPRTRGMDQSLYAEHLRAPGPSGNYPQAQPQPYGTRTHPVPQHEMQTPQSSWAGSSRDAQSGSYAFHPGEQNFGAATGPNIKWGDDTEAGGSQQGP